MQKPHRRATEKSRDDWRTPRHIFDAACAEFGYTIDGAASAENALCAEYFDGTSADRCFLRKPLDLFSAPGRRIWLNPPFSEKRAFIARAIYLTRREHRSGIQIASVLIPAVCETSVWHELIFPHASAIDFYRGRIAFYDPARPIGPGGAYLKQRSGAPTGHALVTFLSPGLNWTPGDGELKGGGCLWRRPDWFHRRGRHATNFALIRTRSASTGEVIAGDPGMRKQQLRFYFRED